MAPDRITIEQMVSLAAGELAPADAAMFEALAGADTVTASELQRIRIIVDALKSTTPGPREAVVSQVKGWMTSLPVAADTSDIVAQLLFDSHAAPLAGYRGSLAERHLMFKAGDAELDIQMTSSLDTDGHWDILGQLDAQGPTIPSLVELMNADQSEPVARTMIGLNGSFSFRAPAGKYALIVTWPGGRFTIEAFEVP